MKKSRPWFGALVKLLVAMERYVLALLVLYSAFLTKNALISFLFVAAAVLVAYDAAIWVLLGAAAGVLMHLAPPGTQSEIAQDFAILIAICAPIGMLFKFKKVWENEQSNPPSDWGQLARDGLTEWIRRRWGP